jgi:hypothetical protein
MAPLKGLYTRLRSVALELVAPVLRGGVGRRGAHDREKYDSLDQLIDDHFRIYSQADHPCRHTITSALQRLGCRPAFIVETGSSAWGTNSSLLFDSYVNSFGGAFRSVDIRAQPMVDLRSRCTPNSTFYCDDSISFLKKISEGESAGQGLLIYLDSWDVDWRDPLASAVHGFQEFLILLPLLQRNAGGLLLVDDTPKDGEVMSSVQPGYLRAFEAFREVYGFGPGKGALIKNFLVGNSIGREIRHEYQLLWEF